MYLLSCVIQIDEAVRNLTSKSRQAEALQAELDFLKSKQSSVSCILWKPPASYTSGICIHIYLYRGDSGLFNRILHSIREK